MSLIKVDQAIKQFNYFDRDTFLKRIIEGKVNVYLYFDRQNRTISIGDIRGKPHACLMSKDEVDALNVEYKKFNDLKSKLQSEKSESFILHLDTLMEAVNGGQEIGVQDFAGLKINRSIKLKTQFDGELPEGVYFFTLAPELTYGDLWVDEDELSKPADNIKPTAQPMQQHDVTVSKTLAPIADLIEEFGESDLFSDYGKGTQQQLIQEWISDKGYNRDQVREYARLISVHYDIRTAREAKGQSKKTKPDIYTRY